MNSSCERELASYLLVGTNEKFSLVILFLCITNTFSAIVSTIGNFLVVTAIWRTRSLHCPSFVLLSGLALSDLAVGLISQPIFVASNITLLFEDCALFSILVRVHEYFANQLLAVSFFTLSVASLDRFLAFKLHLRYQELITVRRIVLCLSFIWITASIFALWISFHRTSAEIAKIVFVLGFSLSTVICYFKIFRVVSYHQRSIESQTQTTGRDTQESRPRLARYKRSVRSLLYIVGVFCVSYLPWVFWVIAKYSISKGETVEIVLAARVLFTVSYSNACFNPFLYCWRMQDIREAIKQQTRVLCKKRARS